MQQFTVPQFIDVEDKIIGPVTTRQFVILMVGFIFISICYKIFDFSLFAVTGSLIFATTGMFAFLRINGRPFHFFVLNLVQTFKRPGLRVWNNHDNSLIVEENIALDLAKDKAGHHIHQKIGNKIYSKSHLAELALIVDTKGVYRGERNADKMDITAV